MLGWIGERAAKVARLVTESSFETVGSVEPAW